MKKKIVVALAVAVLMSQDVKSEPQVLTASQMDEVTASGVFVDVLSLASAQGNFANASTYTRTYIVATPWIEVGFGVGIARAVACCGPDDEVEVAEVASEGIGAGDGAGDRVLRRMRSVVRHSPRFAYAFSVVTVVVISRATPAELQDLRDMGRFQAAPILQDLRDMGRFQAAPSLAR